MECEWRFKWPVEIEQGVFDEIDHNILLGLRKRFGCELDNDKGLYQRQTVRCRIYSSNFEDEYRRKSQVGSDPRALNTSTGSVGYKEEWNYERRIELW